jgi:hypothetical protein
MEVTREIDETDDFESDVEDNILIVKNCWLDIGLEGDC